MPGLIAGLMTALIAWLAPVAAQDHWVGSQTIRAGGDRCEIRIP
jgi:hypothetical protein